MVLCILCREHGTKGKSLARVGIVSDCYAVGVAVVDNTMNARHLVAAYALNGKLVGSNIVSSLHCAIGKMLLTLHP